MNIIETRHPVLALYHNGAPDTPGQPGLATAESKSKDVLHMLTSHSLRASGIFYMLGNLLFIASGISRKDGAQIGTGLAFAAGDALLAVFGGRNDAHQCKLLITRLKAHLAKEGMPIPEGSAINAETMAEPEGFLEKTYDFMHEHINTFKNLAEVLGGAFYFKAGMNQKNPRKMAAGAVIVAGWAAALLIKEKQSDSSQSAGPLENAWHYIQEKPLRLAGWSGLAHNVLSTIGAFEERARHTGMRHYRWDMAGISSMLVANSLYSISHKSANKNGDDNPEFMNTVYAMAVRMLATQPLSLRERALASTADFLSKKPEIKETRGQILRRLQQKVTAAASMPVICLHWDSPIADKTC